MCELRVMYTCLNVCVCVQCVGYFMCACVRLVRVRLRVCCMCTGVRMCARMRVVTCSIPHPSPHPHVTHQVDRHKYVKIAYHGFR